MIFYNKDIFSGDIVQCVSEIGKMMSYKDYNHSQLLLTIFRNSKEKHLLKFLLKCRHIFSSYIKKNKNNYLDVEEFCNSTDYKNMKIFINYTHKTNSRNIS